MSALPEKVLLTCGIGDFIALESYLTPKERSAVKTIYWATRAREALQTLVPFVFPNVIEQITVRDNWGEAWADDFCVASIDELPELKNQLDVVDWSIGKIVEQVKHGTRFFTGSTLAVVKLADVSYLNLPQNFFAAHPYSENVRTQERDLSQAEWRKAHKLLARCSTPIVVINKGSEPIKKYPNTIDLSNKLSLLEALEVVKQSSGFIGSSSVFSVLASKVLDRKSLFIKGHKVLRDQYAGFYYAPHAGEFVYTDLVKPLSNLARRSMKREITINTVQGIGDIFWVYRKLAPCFAKINFNVLVTEFSQVQSRSRDFCKMLPQVGEVSFVKVSAATYNKVAAGKYKVADVIEQHDHFIHFGENRYGTDELSRLGLGSTVAVATYAVNAHLEAGVNLDDIDPGWPIELHVNFDLPPVRRGEPYLCVFIAGAKNDYIWTVSQWVKVIEKLLEKLNLSRIVMVGAEWDLGVQADVMKRLIRNGHEVISYTADLDLDETLNVIRASGFFLGYQSGLSILAENYDVPQLMLYFPFLYKMHYTWCSPINAHRSFIAAGFDEPIDEVVARVPIFEDVIKE